MYIWVYIVCKLDVHLYIDCKLNLYGGAGLEYIVFILCVYWSLFGVDCVYIGIDCGCIEYIYIYIYICIYTYIYIYVYIYIYIYVSL